MKRKQMLSLLLALALIVSLTVPAAAAYTGTSMELTKTEGGVSVTKSSGKSVTIRDGMRLYNGYSVTTGKESYAWISLDSTKLLKVDASSSVEVRKNGTKLEVNLSSGSVFFEVTEKLNENESLNISSSTMSVGVRGTSGWVGVTDQWVTQASILEGTTRCVVADPVTSQTKSAQLVGGDAARGVVYPQTQEGDKCGILLQRHTTEDIPGFVIRELVENVELCDKILDNSGLDVLADLAREAGGDPSGRSPDGKSASLEVLVEAERRQEREEGEKARELEEIQREADRQEHNLSQAPVWEQAAAAKQETNTDRNTDRDTDKPSETETRPSETETPPSGTETPPSEDPTPPDPPASVYTVTFDSQGGSPVASATAAQGGKVTKPADPTREGYRFDGWYREAACENAWNFDAGTVTGDMTLYAGWLPDRYTVTFDPNGGTLSGPGTALTGEQGTVTFPTAPARDGYTFDGWYRLAEGGEQATESTRFTEDTILYAHWYIWKWELNGSTLRIFGTGDIEGHFPGTQPWSSSQSQIINIVIESGITQIGSYAFMSCHNLSNVTIPASVGTIEINAFEDCPKLTSIRFQGTKEQWDSIKGTDTIPGGTTIYFNDGTSFQIPAPETP